MVVPETGSVIDGKICLSQRKIMKTVIAPEEKHVFHHERCPYLMNIDPSLLVCGTAHCT